MKKYFLKDKSLSSVDEDQFRSQDFANNLRKIIECNEAPFNIAVIGKWGLGKSSVVNMALAPLRRLDKKKEFLICEINAWKYEKDEIGKAFLKELWENIKEERVPSFYFFHKDYSDLIEGMLINDDKPISKKVGLRNFVKYLLVIGVASVVAFAIYCGISNDFYGIKYNMGLFIESTILRYCKNIGSILIIPIVVWLGKLFMDKINEPAYKNYAINFPLVTQSDYEIYLKNLLKEYYAKNPDKKIIVVIDDLDRLSANKIVEALDAFKLFMEYERFVFIVPFDDEILKNALRKKRIGGISASGSEYDGEMVLDKIFQYKLYLPQLIKYDMRNYAFEICKNDCSDFIKEYFDNDYKLFEEIVGKLLIHSGVSTPRQVKKIVNTFVENVMIARDREQAGKVGGGFATDKIGLQTIAKISVLQSDYNEFYDLLFKNANAINEILEVHRSNGSIVPSELLQIYFDYENMLKGKYQSLVNYLIFTENLAYSNITPYLYMAQTKEGVLVGDKKQQDFMAAIESCNFVSVKQLIGELPILVSLLEEQLKYNESARMGNIILSAIDCYNIVPEDDKEELAVSITERIPELLNSSSDFRYELINESNLIDVCEKAGNDEYNKLIEYAINRSEEDLNYKDKIALINKIANIKNELSEETRCKYENYTREWMISEESMVQDIIDYTENEGIKYIADIYGKEYVKKVANYITENDDFDDTIIKQFGNIISEFLESNSIMAIIGDLMSCYDYPILYRMLDESIDENAYREISNSKDIAMKIISIGVGKLKGIYGYRILSKLSYFVEDEEGEQFDAFFMNTVGETEFADMILAFAVNNSLDMLPNTIEQLNQSAFENEGYESDIRRLLKLYTVEQAKGFWGGFQKLCVYSSDRNYDILLNLIVELSKENQYDKEVKNIFQNTIIPHFEAYYNMEIYLNFSVQAVSACKDIIPQNTLDEYSSTLMKVMPQDTNSMLNAYRVVNQLNSEDTWCKNVEVLLGYVSKETYAVIYDIITGRLNLFNDKNGNLSLLVSFLVDFIDLSDNPDEVVNILNRHFSNIGKVNQLIHSLMNIEYDEDNASIKLAKFIDKCQLETIIKIIIDEWRKDDTYKEKLVRVLSQSEKYSHSELIYRINENKENMSKNDLLSMLEFCEETIKENNMEAFIDIVEYILENYLEKDVCSQILMRIGSIPKSAMIKSRDSICMVLVEIFRKSSSDENRRKSAVLMKDKGFGRKVRNILDENELKEYKAYLS